MLKNPVLIYQMGKVASAAIRDSLIKQDIENYQVHCLQPDKVAMLKKQHLKLGLKIPPHLVRSQFIIDEKILERENVKIISLLRDPVARNISAFFQNIDKFFPDKKYKNISSEELIDVFIKDYTHDIAIKWFENEFKPTLGIDICETIVDKSKSFFIFEEDSFSVLLIKVEAPDLEKKNAVIDFLDIDENFELLKTNRGKDKPYAKEYLNFKKKIILQKSYLDKMYNSRLIQSFYTDFAIKKMRKRWER